MTSKSNLLINSLIDYINDVKPYHTKFREVTSQLFFNDSINANFTENYNFQYNFQNVWGRDDLGGHLLFNLSEGSSVDKVYHLPATVFPRFSLNDKLNYGQTPHGDDPATQDLTDLNHDGIPDSELPWTGFTGPGRSHQLQSDMVPVAAIVILAVVLTGNLVITIDIVDESILGLDPSSIQVRVNGGAPLAYNKVGSTITVLGYSTYTILDRLEVLYLNTGRYAVPYHQGSRVRVNGSVKIFGSDYVVDRSRSFIQFLPGSWPQINTHLDINLFKSDRLYICWQDPFSYGITPDTFIITATSSITASVIFNNTQPGTHKATLQNITLIGATVGDIWTLTAIGPWTFNVQKTNPINPIISKAYFKTNYNDGVIKFTLDRVWTGYYISQSLTFESYNIEQDINSYISLDVLQLGVADAYDDAEFFSDVNIVTEHGVTIDPIPTLHHPIRFDPFGVIKYNSNLVIAGNFIVGTSYKIESLGTTDFMLIGAINNTLGESFIAIGVGAGTGTARSQVDEYIFEFDSIPPINTYIEFRVEQEGQFNPWANASITEEAFLQITYQDTMVVQVINLTNI